MGKNIISNDVFFSYVGFGIDHDRYLQHLTFFFFFFALKRVVLGGG